MPAQAVLEAGAFSHEIVAVIADQPDLHRLLVQIRGRELLHAVLDDRPCDRERIDLIRLPRLTLAPSRSAHPVRRDPDHPFPGRDQRLLQAPRHLPAALDRPHPLVIQAPRPRQRPEVTILISSELAMPANPTRPVVYRRQRMRVRLCVSVPITIMFTVRFIWMTTDEAELRRTAVTRGDATLLICAGRLSQPLVWRLSLWIAGFVVVVRGRGR